MRILHIEAGTDYGGSVTCLERYLNDIGAEAVKDHKVLFYYKFKGQEIIKKSGVTTRIIFKKGRLAKDQSRSVIARCWRSFKYISNLYLEIRKADVVHLNNNPTPHRMAIRVAKYLKKPLVVHLRSCMIDPVYTSDSFRMLPSNTVLVAVSKQVKESYSFLGLPDDSIKVLYDGVSDNTANKRDEALRKELLNGRRFLVGIVGRLIKLKGVDIFIKAAIDLNLKGLDISFVVIGGEGKEDPGYKQELEKMAKPLGDAIVFTGEIVGGIDRYMGLLDILVLPSRLPEGLPTVVAEALSFGIPVVATPLGGTVEMIDDGVNGLFFEPDNSLSLSDTIKQLVLDSAKRKTLSENAIIVLRERFDIAKASAQYNHWFKYAHDNKNTLSFYHKSSGIIDDKIY